MGLTSKFRSVIASTLVSAAGLYACALAAVLALKGITHQPAIHPAIYFGVLAAVVSTLTGYLIAGRPKEGIPDSLALILVGALSQPLTSGLSAALQHNYWIPAVLLAVLPTGLFIAGVAVRNRIFGVGTKPDTTRPD